MSARVFSFLSLLAVTAAFSRSHIETISRISPYHLNGWRQGDRAPGAEKISLIFAVTQQNTSKLEDLLMRVSDPRSPQYGQHLSNEQVHALVAPLPEHIRAVTRFAESYGCVAEPLTPNSDFIRVTTNISSAEAMLGGQYFEFSHPLHTQRILRLVAPYTLPDTLAAAVDFVSPTIRFPPIRRGRSLTHQSNNLTALNTPHRLRALYKVGDVVGQAPKNKQAVTAFLGQYYSATDLAEFLRLFYSSAAGFKIQTKGDDPTGGLSGIEAMLDAEYIVALGTNITTEFWGYKGRAPDNPDNEPFLEWLTQVSATPDSEVPLIFSSSYGEDEASVTEEYAFRVDVEFQKAGARGISLLFASGDSGVASDKGGCPGGAFVPQWPSGSPFVTAVGGTTGGSLQDNTETAVGLSSGGFSNRYAMPGWQQSAVQHYLSTAKNLPQSSHFNSSSRAFPDVAAQATGFIVVSNLIPDMGVAGTSCASPTAAGIFGLLNDLRLQHGKSSLGFLNPLLYTLPSSALFDITKGTNYGCGASTGFPASEGWDAVTGLGTLNYQALANVVVSLP